MTSSALCLSSLVKHYVPTFIDRGANALAGGVSPLLNGLSVAHVARNTPTTTFGVWFDAGSRYETQESSGASALLQRVIQNDPRLTAAFQEAGVTLTAIHDRQQCGLYATAMREDATKLSGLLAEVLKQPNITTASVNAQRAQLQKDKDDHDADPLNGVLDNLHDGAFMEQGLALPSHGTEEGIAGTSAEQVQQFWEKNYVGNRGVYVYVGQSGEEVYDHVARGDLAKLTAGEVASVYTRFVSCTQQEVNTHVPEAHVVCGYRVDGNRSKYTIPLMVLQNVLGTYTVDQQLATSHPLGRLMCTHKWGKRYQTILKQYHDTGIWAIYGEGLPGVHNQRLMTYLTDEVNRVVRIIEPEEFERAVALTKTQIVRSFDNAEQIADKAANSILNHGELRGPEWYFSALNGLTKDDICNVGRNFFDDVDPVMVQMGCAAEVDTHLRARSYTYWWRD